MIHWAVIHRQLTTAKQHSAIFVLCVALALVTLVGLNSFGQSVNRALLADARKLQAADVIISSRQPASQALAESIQQLVKTTSAEQTLVRQFFTVARNANNTRSLLTELKVIESAYPFYGVVELDSGRPLADVLTSGTVVVEKLVLDRLILDVGDTIRLGEATLIIGDVLVSDPVRPVNFVAFGPRILVSDADLERLNLIRPGSRVRYRTLLKIARPSELTNIASSLSAVADPELERVRTYRTTRSGIQSFFENLLSFLSFVAVFILILAGIGIQSAITAFLRERDNTVAIMKTLGATNRFVTLHFLVVITILGIVGTGLGIAGGILVQQLLPILLADFLPAGITLELSGRVVAESLLLSAVVVSIFTFLPLDRLKELRPGFILRKETIPVPRDLAFHGTLGLLILFLLGMILWQLDDLKRGLYFTGATLVLVLVTAGLTELSLFVLRRLRITRLDLRQAFRGLFRPRNATRSTIITLAAALSVILTIHLLERDLDATFVSSWPEDTPNVIFVDIQPDQRAEFRQLLGAARVTDKQAVTFYPIVRGNIVTINGQQLDRNAERRRRGDNLARQFNLTWRTKLLDDEELVDGESLFDRQFTGAQVSVLNNLFEMREFRPGDTITFRIQGIPLTATVTSVRKRLRDTFSPFFYFVFPPDVLERAPQSIFTAIHMPPESIGELQNRVVARFPNIGVIDINKAVTALASVARNLSLVIRLLAGVSIAAGLLIIVSSVYASRFARTQEAVYFKVLGAKSSFVLRVFALENIILGSISATVAVGMAQFASWALSTWVFDVRHEPSIGASMLLVATTVVLVTTVGLGASVAILRQRPIAFLREQSQE